MIAASCSTRGRFPESDPSADRARAGRTGAPRFGRRGWWLKVERQEAQRLAEGRARLVVAARGGFVNPASKGCVAHTPGASRRSIALAMTRGIRANLGRIAPREYGSVAV